MSPRKNEMSIKGNRCQSIFLNLQQNYQASDQLAIRQRQKIWLTAKETCGKTYSNMYGINMPKISSNSTACGNQKLPI